MDNNTTTTMTTDWTVKSGVDFLQMVADAPHPHDEYVEHFTELAIADAVEVIAIEALYA